MFRGITEFSVFSADLRFWPNFGHFGWFGREIVSNNASRIR